MGTSKKLFVGCMIVGAASSACAFESRTLTYDVPNKASYPPTFPPAPGDYTPLGTWDTVDIVAGLAITTPGLEVPRLDDVFALFSVPAELRGVLARVDISVQGFTWLSYKVDNDNPGPLVNGSVVLDAQLDLYAPTGTAPASGFFDFPPASDLVVVLDTAISGINLDATVNDVNPGLFFDEQPGDGDYTAGQTTKAATSSLSYTSGASFNLFQGTGTTYIPVSFNATSGATGGANIAFSGDTFGAALISVTYTFVPESDLAWAGLPLVVGGWLIRRRIVAAKKA